MPRGPKIRVPRGGSYQPIPRRHRRALVYVIIAAAFFGIFYFWESDVGKTTSSSPFEQHEKYMNAPSSLGGKIVSKQSYDWRKAPFFNSIKKYKELPSGTVHNLPPIQFDFPVETKTQRKQREARRLAVRQEFKRTWDAYKKFAWGKDELKPVSGAAGEAFGGWAATLVDSLDTLWIMGFRTEFREAVQAVAQIDFGKSEVSTISVFESTIRYLGGLVCAYDLSHEPVLLDKAIQVGEMLYRAFDTENNMPLDRLNLEAAKLEDSTGFSSEYQICFAALASLTMEFTRLAQLTLNAKYYDAVARITDFLDRAQNTTRIPGLFPIWINAKKEDMTMDRSFSMGAMADSSFEYFPKMFALLGGLEPVYQKLYEESAPLIDKYLLYRPMLPESDVSEQLLFSGTAHANEPGQIALDAEMQHLTCFIGGHFGLAGRLFGDKHHVSLGERLTEGCIWAYKSMPTGVMPEIFDIVPCESRTSCPWNQTRWEEQVIHKFASAKNDFEQVVRDEKLSKGFVSLRDKRYLLRPEAIESVFIMYRITGHEEYLNHAWDMFTSVMRAAWTEHAFGQILDVTADPPMTPEDKMESFWTAETLKYFYLIFSSPDMISLDDFVFNTEAHPFRRPKQVQPPKVHGH